MSINTNNIARKNLDDAIEKLQTARVKIFNDNDNRQCYELCDQIDVLISDCLSLKNSLLSLNIKIQDKLEEVDEEYED